MPDAPHYAQELAEHLLAPCSSSERPLLTLFMDVLAPAHGGPWPPLLLFHGWREDLTDSRDRARALAALGFCVLNLNLRGRCGTVGEPDANGWELRDAGDALLAARRDYPQLCAQFLPPRAFGVEGGGGNVLALIGKCPDLLSAAVVWSGISDYARWFEWNEAGNYRAEMSRWIAPNPREHPEAYLSRAGLTVAPNRICPLRIVHGQDDDCVPVEQARAYAAAQKTLQDGACFELQELPGVGHAIPEAPHLAQSAAFLARHGKAVYVPPRGQYVVAGFLRTSYFEVRWDHVGLVGSLDLDLRRRRLYLHAPNSAAAQVRLAGPVRGAELLTPAPKHCRILALRQEAGWAIVDLQTHGQRCGLRWKV